MHSCEIFCISLKVSPDQNLFQVYRSNTKDITGKNIINSQRKQTKKEEQRYTKQSTKRNIVDTVNLYLLKLILIIHLLNSPVRQRVQNAQKWSKDLKLYPEHKKIALKKSEHSMNQSQSYFQSFKPLVNQTETKINTGTI